MLARFSVKKPFIVFVAVIIILMLGGVSIKFMKTDLFPEFDVPYLMVITTDVGASPQQVESDVADTLEPSLAKVTGVKNVTSSSSENYSFIVLEFESGTDMDSALVKTSAAVNEVQSSLPDTAGTPTYMEMSMDMMASMYLGVTDSEKDSAELSDYIEDKIIPALERQDGVADVSATGLVSNKITIELNQDKIDLVNDGILGETNSKLASGKAQINSAKKKLDSAEKKLKASQKKLDKSKSKAADQLAGATQATNTMLASKSAYEAQLSVKQIELQTATNEVEKAKIQAEITAIEQAISEIEKNMSSYGTADSSKTSTILSLAEAQNNIDNGLASIKSSKQQLKSSEKEYNSSLKQARESSNINAMLDASTLSQLISAQNFEMPAGYIEDEDGTQWMVDVGDKYTSASQLKKMVLTNIDGLGDITLGDVADVVSTTSSSNSYAKMNDEDGIILAVTKTSTANTSDVSNAVNEQISQLTQDSSTLSLVNLMDQGDYIKLYINTILESLLVGALLAIIVLILFLRAVKPTLIVAFSIPFSVLFAIVIMYFTGLDLNIMTLGALSLSIGMLVDNSIVVMENIYRLKARGLSAPRAAAQGAKQVTGAVVASTLTTICVFVPLIFTSGTVQQLLVPFALTIGYALVASLIVALTVVPAVASKVFVNLTPKSHSWFERLKEAYGKGVFWALRHKVIVMLTASVLLVGSLIAAVSMGIVMIPEMTTNQVSLMVEMPDDMEKDDAYEIVDELGDRLNSIDGLKTVGIVDNSTTTSMMMGSLAEGTDTYSGAFMVYALVDTDKVHTESKVEKITEEMLAKSEGLDCTVTSMNSTEGMSSMISSGASIEVSGMDQDKVNELADEVVKVVESVDGYTEVTTGQEDADETLHVSIDKDKAARLGTTVAQIYQQVAANLKTSTSATTISSDDASIDVVIDDSELKDFTKEDLLDMTFTDNGNKEHKLVDVATVKTEPGVMSISKENSVYTATVSADIEDGYNITLLARELQPKLEQIDAPDGYSIDLAGTNEQINEMLSQMAMLMALGFVLLYLVMVAQFQNWRSPFIIIFTVPLAFTGGLLALLIAQEQISVMALLGFVILMGTVVNNGIVLVDYINQLRMDGMSKTYALVAAGKTRLRPVVMTALTTICSMLAIIFTPEIGSSMQRGMALVVAGGLTYATFMTLFVVPVVYDIFSKKPLRPILIGEDTDEAAHDAQDFIEEMGDDARETYDYESPRQKRKKRKEARAAARGKHSKKDDLD